jgi:hypothetical protein
MRTLLTICAAAVALAIPAGALAHDGHGHHHHFGWWHHHSAQLTKLSGTGTSFAGSTATASGTVAGVDAFSTGTFNASLSTNWSASSTKTSDHGVLSCAPATATLSLVGATTTNTLSSSLTGKTCAWTKTDGTTVRAFFGHGTVTGAGTLASLNGAIGKAFLFQKADNTVTGAVFAGVEAGPQSTLFAVREHDASHKTGNCDHDHNGN